MEWHTWLSDSVWPRQVPKTPPTSSMFSSFRPDPLPSLAVPTPGYLFKYPSLLQPLPLMSLPAGLCFYQFLFEVFLLLGTAREITRWRGQHGEVNCSHNRHRTSVYVLQRNMSLYLSNAPAIPLHSSVTLTCPSLLARRRPLLRWLMSW